MPSRQEDQGPAGKPQTHDKIKTKGRPEVESSHCLLDLKKVERLNLKRSAVSQ